MISTSDASRNFSRINKNKKNRLIDEFRNENIAVEKFERFKPNHDVKIENMFSI